MYPLLISSLVAFGILLLGKFIKKRFNWSENTYLWLALLSFLLAFILHEEVRNDIVAFYIDSHFVSQSAIMSSILGLLCVIVLLLIIIADMHSRGIEKKKDKLPHGKSNSPKEPAVNIKKRLKKDRESILVAISKYPKHEDIEVAKMLSVGTEVAKFHLEELRKIKFAKVIHIQGSGRENIPYREEWLTDQLGLKYLVHHKLIQ